MSGPYREPGQVRQSSIVDQATACEFIEKAVTRLKGTLRVPSVEFMLLAKYLGAKVEFIGGKECFHVYTADGIRRVEPAT